MTESTTTLGAIGSPPGHYAPINGLRLYYEVHGQGRPLVLLHGGLLTLDLAFGPMIPALAEHHQVIGIELQGHGHTGDIDRPMRLDSLADDVASLLELLNLDRADVFGFSVGGMVALTMGLRHPDRIGRLVIASVDHRPNHAEFERSDDPANCVRSAPRHCCWSETPTSCRWKMPSPCSSRSRTPSWLCCPAPPTLASPATSTGSWRWSVRFSSRQVERVGSFQDVMSKDAKCAGRHLSGVKGVRTSCPSTGWPFRLRWRRGPGRR